MVGFSILFTNFLPLALFAFLYYKGKNSWNKPLGTGTPTTRYGLQMLTSFLGGFVGSFLTLFLLFLSPAQDSIGKTWGIAALEELAKGIVPLLWTKKGRAISVKHVFFLFLSSALGFSLFENLLYTFRDSTILFIRSMTSLPLHLSLSGIFGFACGYSHFRYVSRTIWGFGAATLLHGLYNIGGEYGIGVSLSILSLALGIGGSLFIRTLSYRERRG
ncbi:MAG: PrsW family glutamic-type intramembrane protease [Spirochaetales bacterium]